MKKSDIQPLVFDWIRKRQVTDEPFVHELGDVLELSTDSVYRRLRGETALNLYEIERITEVYDFSLDEVMGTSATRLAFNYKPIREESFHFIDYLKYIDNMMSTIAATSNPRMYYMANDIPFFQLMNSPLIASFKLFFWQKTILDFKAYKHLKFKLFEKNDAINELSRSIRKSYFEIPSVEIYSPQTIGTTLRQIEYYLYTGHFEDLKASLLLCDALDQLVEHLRNQCEYGHKNSIKNMDAMEAEISMDDEQDMYKVYFNDILYTDATILVKMENQKVSYLTNNGLNVLSTKDEGFFDNSIRTFEILRRKSTNISKGADRDRNRTFNTFLERIDKARGQFKLYIKSQGIE